ncbi:MAG: hypothetical protein U0V73_09270 [Acidimicrobiia bacterium]
MTSRTARWGPAAGGGRTAVAVIVVVCLAASVAIAGPASPGAAGALGSAVTARTAPVPWVTTKRIVVADAAPLHYRADVAYPQLGGGNPATTRRVDAALTTAARRLVTGNRPQQAPDPECSSADDGGPEGCLTTLDTTFFVIELTPRVASVQLISSFYGAGAAHGATWVDAYNFDLRTGKRLTLTDVLRTPSTAGRTTPEPWSSFVAGEVKRLLTVQLGDTLMLGEDADRPGWPLRSTSDGGPAAQWNVRPDGLVVTFAPYAVAPGLGGSFRPQVVIPWESLHRYLVPGTAPAKTDGLARGAGGNLVTKTEHHRSPRYDVTLRIPRFSGFATVDTVNAAIARTARGFVTQFVRDGDLARTTSTTGPSEVSDDYVVTLFTPRFVSMRFDVYEFVAGAAHPTTSPVALTFDLRTGQPVELGSFVTDTKTVSGPARAAVEKAYPGADADTGTMGFPFDAGAAWSLSSDGIFLAFPQCSVVACALGEPVVEVHWNDIGGTVDGPA